MFYAVRSMIQTKSLHDIILSPINICAASFAEVGFKIK